MRPTFGREYIETEFRAIAAELSRPLTANLIGGGAMSLRDMKDATKDIDVAVEDGDGFATLRSVVSRLGYHEVTPLEPASRELGAASCLENGDGCRLDLFNRQVANALVYSTGMRQRGEPFLATESLRVELASIKDMFLLKAVASRDDDLEDMNTLVQAGIAFDVVRTELETQIEILGDDQFVTYVSEALTDLESTYGVTTPLDNRGRELSVRYYDGLEILLSLDEPKSIDELAAEIDLPAEDVENRVRYLEKFGRVSRGELIEASIEP